MMNEKIDVPSLPGDPAKVIDNLKPLPGSALTFTTPIAGRPEPLTLAPYFRIAHERYSIYLKTVPKV